MSNIPRRHHYVPQFLLRNFADPAGRLWAYDSKRRAKWRGNANSVAFERDFNSVQREDGTMEHTVVEAYLASEVDGPGADAVSGLLKRQKLQDDQWRSFIRFVAYQMMRTPSRLQELDALMSPVMQELFRRMAKYSEEYRSQVTASLKEAGASQDVIDAKLAEAASGETEVTLNRDLVLLRSLNSAEDVARILFAMQWNFCDVHDDDLDLLIGDHPVILRDVGPEDIPPAPLGLSNPNIELMMPLSSRMVAVARWDGLISYGTLMPEQSDLINYHTCRNALRFVYASTDSDFLLANFMTVAGTGPKISVEKVTHGKSMGFLTRFE